MEAFEAIEAWFETRLAALKDDELRETTAMRIRHAAEVERLQRRICTAALGVRGSEQVSVRVQALLHLVKVKMATGEFAAAWDARNAADKLRDAEWLRAAQSQLETPLSVVTVGELLAKHEQEASELALEHRRRRARLNMEVNDALERRGIIADTDATQAPRAPRFTEHSIPIPPRDATLTHDAVARASPSRPGILLGHPAVAYPVAEALHVAETTARGGVTGGWGGSRTRETPATDISPAKFSAVGAFFRAIRDERGGDEDPPVGGFVAMGPTESPGWTERGDDRGSAGVGSATKSMAESLMSLRAVTRSSFSRAPALGDDASETVVFPPDSVSGGEPFPAEGVYAAVTGNGVDGPSVDTPGSVDGQSQVGGRLGLSEVTVAASPASPAPTLGAGGGALDKPRAFGHGCWLRPPQPPASSISSPAAASASTSRQRLPGDGSGGPPLTGSGTGDATPAAWRVKPASEEQEKGDRVRPMAMHEVLDAGEVRAMTFARARDPEARAAAVRMYGDGATRGSSAAAGQRGAEIVSPWGAGAATSGDMFLRAGEDDALKAGLVSAGSSVRSGSAAVGGGRGGEEARGIKGEGLLARQMFPPSPPSMTAEEAEVAASHPGVVHHVDRYVDSVYGSDAGERVQAREAPIISKHQYASRHTGKVLGGYGDSPTLIDRAVPGRPGTYSFDSVIREAGEYARRRAALLNDAVVDRYLRDAGDAGAGAAVRAILAADADVAAVGQLVGPRVSKAQVTEVVEAVKQARVSIRGPEGAARWMSAGVQVQPRVAATIIAATAAPEFREQKFEVEGGEDAVRDLGAVAAASTEQEAFGGARSRGRTPTGSFAEERRVVPHGMSLPSTTATFTPLKLQT